ncbi:hypothetical protein [Brevundimonas sp.]|uniref:hypothetical protein n=1 Tax=Brevundimonas sp. TaxID=1871086 RepID=UPI0028997A39|nr:hypothetical protein [Brevundimonas sp.]
MTMLALHHGGSRPAGHPVRKYTGHETAEAVGLSWERFRKVRADWTRDRDFPAEINEPGEPVRYLAEAVDKWLERRSRRVHAVEAIHLTARVVEARQIAGDRSAARAGRSALSAIKGN